MNPLKFPLGKRKQLFEIQDQPWCPEAVRNGVTELLLINLKILPVYEPTIPFLSKFAKMSGGKWVDLCAGSGGGSILLKQKMPGEIKELILTDLYPHKELKNLPDGIINYQEPVDACNVPAGLKGFRTLFTSFHHLPDDVAIGVLRNAMETKTPIGVFEFTDRSIFCLLMVMPSIIFSFFLILLIFPWKLSRFFWTFIIPAIPFVAFIDIVMSCFRTRNVSELSDMVSHLQSPDYEWKTGKLPTYLGLHITYLTGTPAERKS